MYLAYLPSLPQSRFIYNNGPVYGIKQNLRCLNLGQCIAFLVSINFSRKLLKISSGKNLQGIGAKAREFEACLLHFPQSYLASMAYRYIEQLHYKVKSATCHCVLPHSESPIPQSYSTHLPEHQRQLIQLEIKVHRPVYVCLILKPGSIVDP